MKVLRTAGMVVAAVALVATGVGIAAGGAAAAAAGSATAATALSIGTYASLGAGILSMATAFMAPKMGVEGSATTFATNPQSGLPYAIGRTRMSGLRVYARTYDGFKQQSKHDILAFVAMLSIAGPIHSIEQFTADNEVVTFAGGEDGDANGRFYRYMAQRLSLGPSSGPALDMTFGGKPFPEWTANHKLSGIAHAQWALRFDTDGDLFGAGAPEPAWIGNWVKVYDPRKDSTHPGGSGSHRALDESTYEWSDNPGLHALTWALGRWQNGKRVCGIGAPISTIRVAEFVECANVCEANGWKVGGVEWTTDSKWDTLKRILQAGGAIPTQTGAMIGCLTSTPRTAIATIESRHLLDGLSIAATKSRRDRFNSVIPRYVDEDSDWAVISGTAVTVADYVTADGGQRTKEVDFPLVQVFSGDTAAQPGQLAAYAVVNSREAGPFTWTTGPEWIGLKTGDVVYLNVPEEGLVNQPVLITRRAPDPATGKVSFAGETETYAKHAYALGQSTTPPKPFRIEAPDLKPAAPLAENWTVSGVISGEGFPALQVTGASEMPSADAIVIDYRKSVDEAWTGSTILSAVEPVAHVIAPLESETAYDVRIGYRVGSALGNFTIFANVTTGQGKVTIIEEQLTDIGEQLAQLEADAAQADADIAAAEGAITNIQAEATATQNSLAQAQADIIAQGAAISAATDDIDDLSAQITAAGGEIDTLQTTVGNHGSSITSLQTTVSNHTGTLATHTSQISAANASISTNATAISTANTNIANLTTRVGTAEAVISTNASAITTLQGNVATLTTQVTAAAPNMLRNTGPNTTLDGWESSSLADATLANLQATGFGGRYFRLTVAAASAGEFGIVSNPQGLIPSADSNYVFAASVTCAGTGAVRWRLRLAFQDSGGAHVGYVNGPWMSPAGSTDHSGARRLASAVFVKAANKPAGGVTSRAILAVESNASGSALLQAYQIKYEPGAFMTPYSDEASVTQAFTAISTLDGQYASLSATVGVQGASITSLQSASSTQAGQIATHSSQISAANANISTNTSAISGLNTSVATINSTLTTQGASIATAQSAITTLQGSTATLTTQVMASNQNLIANPSGENGTVGWRVSSGATLVATNSAGGLGRFLRAQSSTLTTMSAVYDQGSVLFDATEGLSYTFAANIAFVQSGAIRYRLALRWFNAAGTTIISTTYGPWVNAHGEDLSGAKRLQSYVSAPCPTGAAKACVIVESNCTGTATASLYIWNGKAERGSYPTAYSNEASVVQTFETLSTLTTQYASLSTTVSTQGVTITSQQTAITTINNNVTTLFGRAALTVDVNGRITGYEINNNGTTGSFTIRSDRFRVLPPSGTTDGFYIDIDGSNRTTQYIRSGSVRVVELGWLV